MNIINILEWDITYQELVDWAAETGADVYAIASYGANNPSTRYGFTEENDFVAFKLKFGKSGVEVMGYSGDVEYDAGAYYAPHIPQIKK